MQWAHDSSGWIAEGGEAYLQNEREPREEKLKRGQYWLISLIGG